MCFLPRHATYLIGGSKYASLKRRTISHICCCKRNTLFNYWILSVKSSSRYMYVRTTFVELSFHNSELRHTNDTKRMVCFFRLSVVISSFALSDGALMCVITSAFCIYIFVNTTQFKIQKVPHHQRIYLVYAFIIIHLYAKLVVARWREKLRHYLLKMYSNEWGGGWRDKCLLGKWR